MIAQALFALVAHVAVVAPARAADVPLPASIRPLLGAHCIDCHEGARSKAGLDLAAVLAADSIDEGVLRALRQRFARRDMPPATEPERPSDAEYRDAVKAIDAVVAPAAREVPAVRRLNRAQFAGATRDVLGVDAERAALLLPRDEVGEGFDTTASTLALPPLLVEKYLDAAEVIADECVPPASRSRKRIVQGESLERRGTGHARDGVAWLATLGTLTARLDVAHAGTFRVTVDACGQFAGDQDPILQVLCDDVAKASEPIRAAVGSLQSVTREVALERGEHTFAARFANDFWDPKNPDPERRDRNLGVARIVVEGPLGDVPPSAFVQRVRGLAGDGSEATRLRAIASSVGEELFRRPLTRSEADALASTARAAAGAQAPFDGQLRALVTAMLVDPRFLLRIERAPASGRAPISATELASRLSFFLWSSVPDAELRRAAAAGELARPEMVRAQVRRMLADPRAASLSQRFAVQWLGIDALETRALDPELFPEIDASLLASMRRESELLFDSIVRGRQPVRALLEARTTQVDSRLAVHYGVEPPDGEGWVERPLPASRGSGVLGHASVLVATSNPTRTSPVKRGKWVLQSLLDDAPPPPPPGVPQLPERPEETAGKSMRELMAMHRANPDCASCHVKMDAIGLAFEAFSADGSARAGADDATELPDGSVLRGVAGVSLLLAKDRAFERSLARQLLVYALGRGTADADDALVDRLAARLGERGDFGALCEEIALSDAFRTRIAR